MQPQKKKLKLEELKINSFITSINDKEGQTLEGGTTPVCSAIVATIEVCPTVSAAVESVIISLSALSAILSIAKAAKRDEGIPTPQAYCPTPEVFCNPTPNDWCTAVAQHCGIERPPKPPKPYSGGFGCTRGY